MSGSRTWNVNTIFILLCMALCPANWRRYIGRPLTMLNAAILLGGVPPVALLERSRSTAKTSTIASHDEHDARSRRLAVAIAAKIRRDPGLIAMAEERVRRRAREASPRERRGTRGMDSDSLYYVAGTTPTIPAGG